MEWVDAGRVQAVGAELDAEWAEALAEVEVAAAASQRAPEATAFALVAERRCRTSCRCPAHRSNAPNVAR